MGKEIEEKTQRHRENSLVFPFLKTLNLLDECSTLRAHLTLVGFSGGSDGKESALNVRDLGSIPGSGRFPGEGNGKPLQYSCLINPMDRRIWWAIDHGNPKKSESFLKHSILAVRSLTQESEEHTFSPQYYLTQSTFRWDWGKEAYRFSGPSRSPWAFFSRLRVIVNK